jgi:predicted dehydrogenase
MGKPKTVVARMATLGHEMECEDVVASTIEFENGALGKLTSTKCAYPGFELRLEVSDSGGSMRIVNNEIEAAHVTDAVEFDATPVEISGETSSQPAHYFGSHMHWRQLSDFTHAILEGRSPIITSEDGRNTLQLVLAAYEAARTGKTVHL